MAPSINIPRPSKRPIMTRKLNSMSITLKIMNVSKKQNGIESPTNMPTLTPMLAMTRIMTRNIAVIIFPSNSDIITSAHTVSSLVLTIDKFLGKVFSNSSLTAIIFLFASIAFAPTLNRISSVTAS